MIVRVLNTEVCKDLSYFCIDHRTVQGIVALDGVLDSFCGVEYILYPCVFPAVCVVAPVSYTYKQDISLRQILLGAVEGLPFGSVENEGIV